MIPKLTRAFLVVPMISVIVMSACTKDRNNNGPVNYTLNTGAVINWKGVMDNGFNNGSFDVGASSIETQNGVVTGGNIVFPIASIKNFNIPDPALKEQLLHHLKSADFFNIAVYSEASFRILKVQPYNGEGNTNVPTPNFQVEGSFTMLGKSNNITFPAYIRISGDQMDIAAAFSIDRTLWGMTYASDPAGQQYIHKDVELQLNVSAHKM
ncbi:YceI family protein [Chitinophaga sp. 22536]|uniref:YceI family protein n=1 Tax=unclassified Chitinophaga TaxID=2619133 RepID=UPI003F82716A